MVVADVVLVQLNTAALGAARDDVLSKCCARRRVESHAGVLDHARGDEVGSADQLVEVNVEPAR